MSMTISRNLLGLGVAASLFLGCQQFTGQEDGKPSDPALRMGEVAEADSSQPEIPPAPTLCDSLRHALAAFDPVADPLGYGEAKQRLYDACMSQDPVTPPPVGHTPASCAAMRTQLAEMDPASEKYAGFRTYINEVCPADPTPTSPPAPTLCDSLRHALAAVDPVADAQGYGLLKQRMYDACSPPEPVVPPTPVYTPEACARMRAELAAMESIPDKHANYRLHVDAACPAAP